MALGIPMALLLSGAAAGGGSALGGFFGRGPEQETGFDVFKPETFPGFEGLQGTNIQFLQEELKRIRNGEIPISLQGPAERLREGQQQSNQERFFGTPGQRSNSLVNRAVELGSIAGVGPKGAIAQGQNQLAGFNSASSQIDQFIDNLLLQGTTQANQFAVGSAQTQPSGPPQTVIPFGGGAVQSGGALGQGFSQLGAGLGSALSSGAFGQQQAFAPGQQFAGGTVPGQGITGGPGSAAAFAQQMANLGKVQSSVTIPGQ